jgi:hypothetical protein
VPDERAHVLVSPPGQDDAHSPGQGLLDPFDPRHVAGGPPAPDVADVDLPVLDCCRLVLDHVRTLAIRAPVVVAVDDLPWLDDLTQRALRFAVRLLADAPVVLLATARSWSPGTPAVALPEIGGAVDLFEVGEMAIRDLRRIVVTAVPGVGAPGRDRHRRAGARQSAVRSRAGTPPRPFVAVRAARIGIVRARSPADMVVGAASAELRRSPSRAC